MNAKNLSMRFALPLVQGRGAGLGNEMHSWAKAFIGGQALNLHVLHPGWGFNTRQYWRYFQTSRADRVVHEILRKSLPTYHFSEHEYRKRLPASFYDAVCDFGKEHGLHKKRTFVLEFEGMWGGLPAIAEARDFVMRSLLATRYTSENMYTFRKKLLPENVNIGIHIRRGDFFKGKVDDYTGKFNTALPIDWYLKVCREIRKVHPKGLSFCLVGDATQEELQPILNEIGGACIRPPQLNSDISDLIALSTCDVQICSVSSFSMWAAFLSSGRYVWFAPNLIKFESRGSIWRDLDPGLCDETLRISPSELESRGYLPRGVPVSWDGSIPDELHDYIDRLILLRRRELDLLLQGSVKL